MEDSTTKGNLTVGDFFEFFKQYMIDEIIEQKKIVEEHEKSNPLTKKKPTQTTTTTISNSFNGASPPPPEGSPLNFEGEISSKEENPFQELTSSTSNLSILKSNSVSPLIESNPKSNILKKIFFFNKSETIHELLDNLSMENRTLEELEKKVKYSMCCKYILLNERGETPITTLLKSVHSNTEIKYYFLLKLAWYDFFVEINIPDLNLMNSIDYAIEIGDERIIKLLLLFGAIPTNRVIKSNEFLEKWEKFASLIFRVNYINSTLKRINFLKLSMILNCLEFKFPSKLNNLRDFFYNLVDLDSCNEWNDKYENFTDNKKKTHLIRLIERMLKNLKYVDDERSESQDKVYELNQYFSRYFNTNLIEDLGDLVEKEINKKIFESYKSVPRIPFGKLYVSKCDISSGGNAQVYLGYYNSKVVACKSVTLNKTSQQILFVKEVGVYALNNLVPIKIHGICFNTIKETKKVTGAINYDNNLAYIVMDLAHCTLTQLLRKVKNYKDITWEYVFSIFESSLTQLKYVHDNSIVHRDIKTSNFLLSRCGEVALSDFGSGRIKRNEESLKNSNVDDDPSLKNIHGTPGYIAPEVGDGVYSKPSDISSLSKIFWILLVFKMTGLYFPVVSPMNSKGYNIRIIELKGYRLLFPIGSPKKLVELIEKMWQIKPENRPTVDEIIEMVKEIKESFDFNYWNKDNGFELLNSDFSNCFTLQNNPKKIYVNGNLDSIKKNQENNLEEEKNNLNSLEKEFNDYYETTQKLLYKKEFSKYCDLINNIFRKKKEYLDAKRNYNKAILDYNLVARCYNLIVKNHLESQNQNN
ncbi:hypothetical protein RB653_010588 [Dictyostelium firmibasis]|uniref:Protein kinase domain-containing protein n=1 Tax=Dictyostelium firmibasis TaxID=79012 RepID=A0AAN7YW29_9MYCE